MWRERCQGTEAVRPLPDRLAAIAICSATTSPHCQGSPLSPDRWACPRCTAIRCRHAPSWEPLALDGRTQRDSSSAVRIARRRPQVARRCQLLVGPRLSKAPVDCPRRRGRGQADGARGRTLTRIWLHLMLDVSVAGEAVPPDGTYALRLSAARRTFWDARALDEPAFCAVAGPAPGDHERGRGRGASG
jgi:hypothetical protein